jgi:pimeloyl-ACP methyl ester carboxylesterase
MEIPHIWGIAMREGWAVTMKLFLHGVPDSAAIWRPLIQALGLQEGDYIAPTLPGFDDALPSGFAATKEAYVGWLLHQMEALVAQHGPIDLIGHDWGALIIQRAAMLRPEWVRSWVVMNAVIEPEYRGHRLARIWSTPIVGEIFMSVARPGRIARSLIDAGVPSDVAHEEAAQWAMADKRRAILQLYRSADGLSFKDNWAKDIGKLPRNGALIWGEDDPFVPLAVAERFSNLAGYPLYVVAGASHWAVAAKPMDVAAHLMYFWTALQK